MIKTEAINLKHPEKILVTWDTGRRCNYDCSYCETSRHDNHSKHHPYEELISTYTFVKHYVSIYNEHRNITGFNINFTGGEPTVNPAFWKLAEYIKNDDKDISLSLTTNGAWSPKKTSAITNLFNGITISYHAESDVNLKQQVLENIRLLHNSNLWLQVNVMMHVDHYDECIDVCNMLKEMGVKYNPRPIGDGNIEKSGWFKDRDGSMRRTSHSYSSKQQEWYFDHLNISTAATDKKEGTQLGRSCCGGRCTLGKVDDNWQEVKLVDTHFKDWYCMVDWFFLHIDQHTGEVYHHQTCQALHDGKRGSIGNLKNTNRILEHTYERMVNPQPIICPNTRCGCGMCVPKAKDKEEFDLLWKYHTLC